VTSTAVTADAASAAALVRALQRDYPSAYWRAVFEDGGYGAVVVAAQAVHIVTNNVTAACALPAASRMCVVEAPVRESAPGGLTREVETPLPSNSPHDHMILRVDLEGSHGRWKRPCLQTAHMTI
jgi:hypothetical protein